MNTSVTNNQPSPEPALLLTRPQEASERFVAALAMPDVRTIISPIMRITGTQPNQDTPNPGTLIFTSEHAVHFYQGPWPRDIFVVGQRTAKALETQGRRVNAVFHTATTLLNDLPEPLAQPIVHVRGAHIAVDIAQTLRDRGHSAHAQTVYDQIAQPLSNASQKLLLGEQPVVVPLFSPRSAALLLSELDRIGGRAPVVLVAMSQAIAQAMGKKANECHIAARPNMSSMIDIVRRQLRWTDA